MDLQTLRHHSVSTMTCTINNNTVATNNQDVLAAMLRLCDPEELARYNDLTPTTLDYVGNYCDGVDRMPYQLQCWQTPGQGLDTVRLAVMDVGAPAWGSEQSIQRRINAVLHVVR